MNTALDNGAFLALVDDDSHSAQLMMRMLTAHGAPRVELWGGAESSSIQFSQAFDGQRSRRPSMLIVDLKQRSSATGDFISVIRDRCRAAGILIAAVVPSPDRASIDRLHEAGAAGVFERHPELAAYRQEAAGIVSFWVRNQRLNAVGA